ncbi:MAG: DNA polymerase IV, partial [Chloroflexi bacterium]|nr:DNA polymerase IV [Chloroflexota bacterium]
TVIAPGSEREFLTPLAVNKLWGVGPKTAERLAAEDIHTIGDLASRPEEWFRSCFGKTGPQMMRLALGEDDRPVVVERDRKSISSETTLTTDTGDPEALYELVSRLSQQVAKDLKRHEIYGRTVKLKLRLSDFTTFTRQKTMPEPVQSPEDVVSAASALLSVELQPNRKFRLIGVGVSGFDEPQEQEAVQLRLAGFE